ncbi:MAG: hypothetical protein R2695_14700 [Acidimicrobiales bacterium]
MTQGAARLVGVHDFTAFSKRNKSRPVESFVRDLRRAEWHREGDLVRFEVEANAFTHQMVRSLVGLLVEIGRGRRPVQAVDEALAAGDRSGLPSPAPPHGLVLWRCAYS